MAMCSTITHSPTFSLYNQWSLKISLKCHIESENACKNNLIRTVFWFSQIPICQICKNSTWHERKIVTQYQVYKYIPLILSVSQYNVSQ